MLGNVRGRNRRDSPPTVAQNESRHSRWKSDPGAQNCAGDGGDERGARLAGGFLFRGCAAGVCLRLTDDASRSGALRLSFVHRARGAFGAAGHPRLRSWQPAGTDGAIGRGKGDREDRRRHAPAEPQHSFKDAGGTGRCQIQLGARLLRPHAETPGTAGKLRPTDFLVVSRTPAHQVQDDEQQRESHRNHAGDVHPRRGTASFDITRRARTCQGGRRNR